MSMKVKNLESILDDWKPLIKTLLSELDRKGIRELNLCDHICYRVETLDRYQEVKEELLQLGKLAAETIVSGRPITIIHLDKPLHYQKLKIDCVELPAPKKGSDYPEGWEHAEFVISNLDDFLKRHSGLDFNTKAMSREVNPELGLKVSSGFQVKFHPFHILEVIQRERELGITEVV